MTDAQMSPEQLGKLAADFLGTEYGKHVLAKLSVIYNAFHHEAEDGKTMEVKALAVERAAGVKEAIDLLTRDAALYKQGHFNKETPAKN